MEEREKAFVRSLVGKVCGSHDGEWSLIYCKNLLRNVHRKQHYLKSRFFS